MRASFICRLSVAALSILLMPACATQMVRKPTAEAAAGSVNVEAKAPAKAMPGNAYTKNLARVQARVEAFETSDNDSLRERCRQGKLWRKFGGMTICKRELREQDRLELEWAKLELAIARELREGQSANGNVSAETNQISAAPVSEPIAPVVAPVTPVAPVAPIAVKEAPPRKEAPQEVAPEKAAVVEAPAVTAVPPHSAPEASAPEIAVRPVTPTVKPTVVDQSAQTAPVTPAPVTSAPVASPSESKETPVTKETVSTTPPTKPIEPAKGQEAPKSPDSSEPAKVEAPAKPADTTAKPLEAAKPETAPSAPDQSAR